MELSRRRVLTMLSATGLLSIARPQVAGADTGTDRARLLANTVAVFAGTPESNLRPEVATKLAGIDQTARTWLAALDRAGDGELFSGLALGSSDINLTATYQHLYEIALATRAVGTTLEADGAVQRKVIDGLAWLHERYYGDQASGYYGNWFNWEIGIPTHVTKTLVLLADQVAAHRPELPRTYVASMDAYLRNGRNGDVDLDSRFHTGANLADITTNRILQGALLGDDARIRKALEDQLTVFATIDPYHLDHGVSDGYYADGSFIQHHSVAYTGAYGKVLLTRVVQTVKILDGTAYARGDELVAVVQGWVRNGFAPVIFEGWMMEIVKGRAVSRPATGYADVAAVVEAVVDLSGYATGVAAAALKSYVKFVRATSRATLDPATFVSPVSVVRYADIVADSTILPVDLSPAERSVAFSAMEKNVHRRSGYAFALARSSDRISKYEYMNGENLMPWFQGDGAHYLYLSGQDQSQAFGVDYFTTVSPYGLAGVTAPVEQRQTIPELYGKPYYDNPAHPLNFTSSSESQNTYVYFPRGTNRHSGGATLDGLYSAVGMVQSSDVAYAAKQRGTLPDDFTVYRNAAATKSWFLLDDDIVILVAGGRDPAGRVVTTTLDARIAAPSDQVAIAAQADGSPWTGTGTARLDWLRYANTSQGTAVGYVLLGDREVEVRSEQVTRSRRVVRTASPDTRVTKQVFSLSVAQPAGAPSSLAYALVPNATEDLLRSYRHGPLKVVANNSRLQAIQHRKPGIVAANVFARGWHHAATLVVDGPASVVQQTKGRTTTVAVADPTTDRDRIRVILRGRPLTLISGDDGVRATRIPGGTQLEFTTRHRYGRTVTATLRA